MKPDSWCHFNHLKLLKHRYTVKTVNHTFVGSYVLDGYPITKKQVDLMNQRSIIPVRVIELEMNSNEVMVRGTKDRLSPARSGTFYLNVCAFFISCRKQRSPKFTKNEKVVLITVKRS